jgi:hypothetical protein
MDVITYFVGRKQTEAEAEIMHKWGTMEIDPVCDSPIWKVSLLSINDLFTLCNELDLITFRTYLPEVNGAEPILEFILAQNEELC